MNTNIILLETDKVSILDSKTVLQHYDAVGFPVIASGHLLVINEKNICTAFDMKGNELWKQNLVGEAQIIAFYTIGDNYLVFYKNKELKIFSQINELKLILDCPGNEINVIMHEEWVAVYDDLQNYIHMYLIDDLLEGIGKTFRILKGATSKVIKMCINHTSLYAILEKSLLVYDIPTGQIQQNIQLESNPISLAVSFENAYVGCANRNIYQIKINNNSDNYTLQPINQQQKQRVLVGHLSEVISLAIFMEDGYINLASVSTDGHFYIWLVEGDTPKLIKKILTLKAKSVQIAERPDEFKFTTEHDALFKYKRPITLKPIKKSKYTSEQQILVQKRIKKLKFQFEIKQRPTVRDESTINELLEENKKLKQIIHQLI